MGLVRNVAGAGFPLFGTQMYHKLGNQGATSLLDGLAVLMVPIPFILAKYGRALRERSPWARVHMEDPEDDDIADGEDRGIDESREDGLGRSTENLSKD
jgi:hypothetical protein